MDAFAFLDNYHPAGAASNPELDALVRQIILRLRQRLAAQQALAQAAQPQQFAAPYAPPPQIEAAPQIYQPPQPTYAPPPPAVQPAPAPYPAPPPGVPPLGQGGNTPWTAAGYGGAAPTPGTAGNVYGASMAGMPLFPAPTGPGGQTGGGPPVPGFDPYKDALTAYTDPATIEMMRRFYEQGGREGPFDPNNQPGDNSGQYEQSSSNTPDGTLNSYGSIG